MARDNLDLKKGVMQTKTQQQQILTENSQLKKELIQITAKQQQKQTECVQKHMKSIILMNN